MWYTGALVLVLAALPALADQGVLLPNGGFEAGTEGWHAFWTRDAGAGAAALDVEVRHDGEQSIRIEHRGDKDWSLGHTLRLRVQPGEIFELSAWVRMEGTGSATLGVVTLDAGEKTLDWSHGSQTARGARDWLLLRCRFSIPPGTAAIQPRLIGSGPATVWLDDVALSRKGTLDDLRSKNLPASVSTENSALRVTFKTADATFAFLDRRSGREWVQRGDTSMLVVLSAAPAGPGALDLRLLDASATREIAVTARLDGDLPEAIVTLKADGGMEGTMAWPSPIESGQDQRLIVPVNEGIAYPAGDESLPEMFYHLYGGHGLCMPWYGAAAGGGGGWMAIVESPDDAAVRIPRRSGLLCLAPEWQPQKGAYGPGRKLRYVFFDRGGHVAMAKRYREHARKTGLLRTLEEKRKANPNVDLLVGAVNIWCWDKDAAAWCRELQSNGIRRILWSNGCAPEQLKALNELGVLTSRYDIYQDAMDPANFPRLGHIHSDWTGDAWKRGDLATDAQGNWIRGWGVDAKDGERIPCGVLCDRQAVAYARERIPPELETHPYRCRFIDTTTASPWRECYDPRHPMTRTESKRYKMELLQYVSEGCGLVCGSETGHDAAVPFVHYFEGMLSLGPYRVPESGREMMKVWTDVPEPVAKFQTGYRYRLPLWELVYHDCVVAQWYWGDYNNKLPSLWDRRDLWNALYGTPPMFMFNRSIWEANKERFVRSYQTAAPVARATGYAEMTNHEWLAPDGAVQRTRFANGIAVTVNFWDQPFTLEDGRKLGPLGCAIDGMRVSEPSS
jgi:hypothetical protein